MNVIAVCGCEIDVDVWIGSDNGCCCGDCYIWDYPDVNLDGATIEKACKTHGGE